MPLSPSTRLGPYEIVAPLGAGGMGEVYRAKDTRLGRTVAVKVLAASATASTDSRRRFEQEARAASALNHPNVLVLHDVGDHDGAPFVVTELLEGTTLRGLLASGPLPAARAVAIAADVARGLAAAHERGIVHRDIKPENVLVTKDGRVKILDFGVATFIEVPGREALDTMTASGTEPGVVLGTVGYMAPEQIRGERADARSDVFALGVVLYEMVAGGRPFTGNSKVETLHAILTATPPDLAEPPAAVSPTLARIVGHCLEKDAAMRFQAARDVAFALEVMDDRASGPTKATAFAGSRRRWGAWAGGAAVLIALAGLASVAIRRAILPPAQERDVRFDIPTPANGTLQGILGISSAVAPDGAAIVLAVTTESGNRLFLRRLSSTAAVPIDGTEGAMNPFWSPDSRWVAFFTATRLKRVPAAGGPPETIADIGATWATIGTWARGDTILISDATTAPGGSQLGGILRVAASGGQPALALPAGSAVPIRWPSALPDGRHFLFMHYGSQGAEIRLGQLDSTATTTLLRANSRAVYAAPGYLLFVRDGILMAQRFDAGSLQLSGAPTAIADGLLYFRAVGNADFSASDSGMLVYQAGDTASRLVWYGRSGVEESQLGPSADYFFVRLSPSGRQVAVDVMDRRTGVTDLEVFEGTRGGQATVVTSDDFVDWTPVFSPDEQQLVFASSRRGPPHLHLKRLRESGNGRELLAPTLSVQFVTDWVDRPDGGFIVFNDDLPQTRGDIFAVRLTDPHTREPLVQTAADEADGRVSPDGRWLAYISMETGQCEVFVRALRGSTEHWQVSNAGGLSPRWRRDGSELYYLSARGRQVFAPTVVQGQLMAVPVRHTSTFEAGPPVPLFSGRFRQGQYEPSADGKRFLVNSGSGSATLPITVSTNWLRALQ